MYGKQNESTKEKKEQKQNTTMENETPVILPTFSVDYKYSYVCTVIIMSIRHLSFEQVADNPALLSFIQTISLVSNDNLGCDIGLSLWKPCSIVRNVRTELNTKKVMVITYFVYILFGFRQLLSYSRFAFRPVSLSPGSVWPRWVSLVNMRFESLRK